jgi:hypothetical protein
LKLSLYYNNKFVLYYLNAEKTLFTKTFTTLGAAFSDIEKFFSSEPFLPDAFKVESTWGKNCIVHFSTKDFNYTVNKKTCLRFLRKTILFNFLPFLLIFLPVLIENRGLGKSGWTGFFFLSLLFILVGGGIQLILFFNYFFNSRHLRCVMSKGNPVFLFGKNGDMKSYQKQQIEYIQIRRTTGRKSPIDAYAIIDIFFTNRESIRFTSLLLSLEALHDKMRDIRIEEINTFPFLLG